MNLNPPLAAAYSLEEDLRHLWKQPDEASATRLLDS
jgi:hypothetical protein